MEKRIILALFAICALLTISAQAEFVQIENAGEFVFATGGVLVENSSEEFTICS